MEITLIFQRDNSVMEEIGMQRLMDFLHHHPMAEKVDFIRFELIFFEILRKGTVRAWC